MSTKYLIGTCILGTLLIQYAVAAGMGEYSSAAVAVDGQPCADIAMDIQKIGGTVVDSAIAALFCNGVVNPQSMGIGGGFFMTYYRKADGKVDTLNAREMAPWYAYDYLFEGNRTDNTRYGPHAVAIPGEIKGYWKAKKRYGNPNVPWATLIEPTIEMCRNGIETTARLASSLRSNEDHIRADPGLSSVFVKSDTDELVDAGELYTMPALANTLERISLNGSKEFYFGITAENLIQDLQNEGGHLTMADLEFYDAEWASPITVNLASGHTYYAPPPPAGGVIMAYVLNILQNYNVTPEDGDEPVWYQRIAEAFKWAYGQRSHLGDPADAEITSIINDIISNVTSTEYAHDTFLKISDTETVNDVAYYGGDDSLIADQGTAHLSIVGLNGDAVAVTSTVNLSFGNKYMSPSTGIITNNEMNDFSYENMTSYGMTSSPNNLMKPGKRPQSSACPSIIVDSSGDVSGVLGTSGGVLIPSVTTLVYMRHFWQGMDLQTAMDLPRMHHQLIPMTLVYEEGLDQDNVDYLEDAKHETTSGSNMGACNAVTRDPDTGRLYAMSDSRRGGGNAGIDDTGSETTTTAAGSLGASVMNALIVISIGVTFYLN